VIAGIELRIEGEHFLDGSSARAGLIVLAALLLSFLFIRTSARLMRSPKVPSWPGSVKTEGGLHVHHLVFGIVLLIAMGFALALQPPSPWLEIAAGGFGVGAGLTLDEYALWLHLEDVYWAEEGRRSVDAVIIAALIGGLILMGFLPVSTDAGAVTIIAPTAVVLTIAVVAVMKGKYVLGVVGMLVPIVGLVRAVRLAKPGSPWARRRYTPGSAKLSRAARRYERHTARYQRFQNRLAGAPAVGDPTDR
jgi:hypothetical protein